MCRSSTAAACPVASLSSAGHSWSRVRLRLHHQPAAPKINVTPLIDVVMVLIVFFLIVGKLASDRVARIDLPESGIGTREGTAAPLIINLAAGGPATNGPGAGAAPAGHAAIIVEQRTLTPTELLTLLKLRRSERPDLVVQLRADRRLTYGQVAPTLGACREAGLASVRLVTEREP